ncbi:hypothetical protein [Janthinobacterium sp.]|uniref:hypothetical protein n=1 Tax=Janthinobacterium sp. TaxID=1871054 RepID=UPI00293D6EAB|nr:hypothetical protein [Janthinobacterium sp.]
MKTMQWLIKRELWEHKGMLLWTPLAVATLMTLFAAVMLAFGHDANATLTLNGQERGFNYVIGNAYSSANRAETIAVMSRGYLMAAAPIFLMLGGLVFFYCLGALFDERRDRSLLFWKSLPVSDAQTVASKALMALTVAPAISVAIGALTALLILLMLCLMMAFKGVNMLGYLLASPDLYLAPLHIIGLLPLYALWALPTVGWLLMVSAWVRSKVFLWAVGAPLLAGLLALWANKAFGLEWNIEWFMQNVISRILLGAEPGYWFVFDKVQQQSTVLPGKMLGSADVFTHSWATLGSASPWIGAAAGLAMLYAAVRLRQWRAEG